MQAKYQNLKYHPACESLPPLSEDAYLGLKSEIISARQVHVPIGLTPDGLLLDGRHRYRVVNELETEGIKVKVKFETITEDPYAYVERMQMSRRNFTPAQRAAWGHRHKRYTPVIGCDHKDAAAILRITTHPEADKFLDAIIAGTMTPSVAMRTAFPPAKKEPAPVASRAFLDTPSPSVQLMRPRTPRALDNNAPRRHFVIPDTQVRPGAPLKHIEWLARYAADKRPDVIVHLGDHYDLASLSSYDKGTKAAEGKRLDRDIASGQLALKIFQDTLAKHAPDYKPELHMLTGNHEERLIRHGIAHPELFKPNQLDDLGREQFGWTTYPFLEPVTIDGIKYCHYFVRNTHGAVVQSKRGMPSAREQVKREGMSAISGHKQGLDVHIQQYDECLQIGIIAGSCYLHDESYLTPQGTTYWRGALVLNHVVAGEFSPWFIDLDWFCRRYEGKPLAEFLAKAKDSELLKANV